MRQHMGALTEFRVWVFRIQAWAQLVPLVIHEGEQETIDAGLSS